MKFYGTALLLTLLALAGCSGFKTYPDNLARNLDIHTATDSGSILSSIEASLDVYSVNPDCSAAYEGSITLDTSTVSVGLPVGRPSYLVFRFNGSSFLASSSSVTGYDTLFTPLQGRRYDVDVSYIDDIYHVAISEKTSGKSAPLGIEPRELHACKR